MNDNGPRAAVGNFPFKDHLPMDEADFMVFEICNRGIGAVTFDFDEYGMRHSDILSFYWRNKRYLDLCAKATKPGRAAE